MVNEVQDAPITQAEIDAVKAQLVATTDIKDLMSKNGAVLTVTMPVMLRALIDKECENADGSQGSAADWARQLLADRVGFILPTKGVTKVKKDKRSQEVQVRAQRAMYADLVERARRGEIDLG